MIIVAFILLAVGGVWVLQGIVQIIWALFEIVRQATGLGDEDE